MAQFALTDDLSDYLGRAFETTELAQADLLLQLASAAIQSEAHQSLEYVEDDEVVLRGGYGGHLWLPERPVVDVTEVTLRNGVGLPLSLPLTVTQYTWDRMGLLNRGPWVGGGAEIANADVPWGGWGGPKATVVVTYSHGYEVIPDAIKGVCLSAAARAFLSPALSNPASVGLESEAVDGYSVTYRNNVVNGTGGVTLAEDESRIVKRYRPVVMV